MAYRLAYEPVSATLSVDDRTYVIREEARRKTKEGMKASVNVICLADGYLDRVTVAAFPEAVRFVRRVHLADGRCESLRDVTESQVRFNEFLQTHYFFDMLRVHDGPYEHMMHEAKRKIVRDVRKFFPGAKDAARLMGLNRNTWAYQVNHFGKTEEYFRGDWIEARVPLRGFDEMVDAFEEFIVKQAMEGASSLTEAANRLSIQPRRLSERLKSLGLKREDVQPQAETIEQIVAED